MKALPIDWRFLPVYDEYLYVQATRELDEGYYSRALWTKALSICRGDKESAYYEYVELRVEQLYRSRLQEYDYPDTDYAEDDYAEEYQEGVIDKGLNIILKGILIVLFLFVAFFAVVVFMPQGLWLKLVHGI